MIEKLKKVYDDSLKIYQDEGIKLNDEERKKHISRLFRYGLELSRMDFVSKNCLNPLFAKVLKQNGFEKSQDFMRLVKEERGNNNLFFVDGILMFNELKGGLTK